MSIHLGALSRRTFLKQSAAAASGVLFLSSRGSGQTAAAADHWALLADTHVAAQRDLAARGVVMADHLADVARQLLALERSPAGVVIAGDCAYNSGESGDYRTLMDLLAPLESARLPLHLTLGNHDHRQRFWSVLADRPQRTAVEGRHVAVVESPRANWFFLDTLDETNVTPGRLGGVQLEWLAAALDARPDKPALVVAHHNPIGPADKPSGLLDTDALLEVLAARRQVKAYFFGHTHHWEVKQQAGIWLVNLPPVAYVFRAGEPSGWVHCRLADKGATLELHCLDASHHAHRQRVELAWRTA